jgi:hypothetical protein
MKYLKPGRKECTTVESKTVGIQILKRRQSADISEDQSVAFKNGKPMSTHLVYCKYLFSNQMLSDKKHIA